MKTRPRRVLIDSEAGIALAILLVVVGAVMILALAMSDQVIREVQIAFNQANAVGARYLAEAGIAAGLAEVAQDLNWTGFAQEQSLGNGTFMVSVQNSTNEVKVLVSRGRVRSGSLAGAEQTIRMAFTAALQPFAILSNTTVAFPDHHGALTSLTMGNTASLPRAIHANNLTSQLVAIDIQDPDIRTPIGGITGRLTASSGAINVNSVVTCTGCNPATNQPRMLFPMFNWNKYRQMAQASGTYFLNQAAFNAYVAGLPVGAGGYKTLGANDGSSHIFFVEGNLTIAPTQQAPPVKLKVYGTIVSYNDTDAAVPCTPTRPCGAIDIKPSATGDFIIVAQNGEPAFMAGEIVKGRGPSTITGLIYTLGSTIDPTVVAPVDGFHLHSVDGDISVTGAVMSQRIDHMEVSELNYNPAVFQKAPSGLLSSWGWLIAQPLSWSSGK